MKILFLTVFVLLNNCLFSQDYSQLSREPDTFVSQIEAILQNSKNISVRENYETFILQFAESLNSGRFDKNEMDDIVDIAQLMVDKRLENDAVFYLFLKNVNHIAQSPLNQKSISNYLIYTNDMLLSCDKNAIKENLNYSNNFFEKNILNTNGNIKWYLRDAEISFPKNDAFVISVKNGTLSCASEKDDFVIENTKGVFSKDEMSWTGKGGRTYMELAGDDESKPYVVLAEYSIDMKSSGYVADSVKFYNSNSSIEPWIGQLQDKVSLVKKDGKSKYPVFKSYKDDEMLSDVFNNINLIGCVGIQGPDMCVFGNSLGQTLMTICHGDTISAEFIAESFVISGDKLKADNAFIAVYVENDSIIHSGMSLMYDNATREILAYNPDRKMWNGPFYDTYHNIRIFSEAMIWNLDENKIRFHKVLSQYQDSRAYFKSMNFYDKFDWDRLQGIDDYNPLTLVNNYLQRYETDVIDVQLFASYIKRNVEQVVSMLMRLVEQGYMTYDSQLKMAYPTESLYQIIKARYGYVDYDVIKIESYTTNMQPNMVLDLSNNDLTVNGVRNVMVSNAKNVKIVPYDNSIVIKKNLDFEFSGKMMAGLFEFHTHSSLFNYSDFLIELPTIDSLVFFVKSKDKSPNTPEYMRVKDVITHVSGKIYIDETTNKSGKVDNANYPIFDCSTESQIDFESVSFILPPFNIDSLFTYSTSEFNLKGIVRSGVFKDFEDELVVKDDYTLGFTHGINVEGLRIVNSDARFSNEVKLTNGVFWGDGTLSFMTAFAESDSVTFDDSMAYMKGRFEMLAVNDLLSVPYVMVDSVDIKMFTKENRLFVNTLTNDMELYGNCSFKGEACLTQTGFYGKGLLKMNGTTVESDYFVFRNNSFEADSANIVIADENGAEDMIASNYSFSVDFEDNTGLFESVNSNSNITFPQNKVMCELDYAKWTIDAGTVSLTSRRHETVVPIDSIVDIPAFRTKNMDYDFASHTIMTHDVDSIQIADASVLLDGGELMINENSNIRSAGNATIRVGTYTIHDAHVEILGINDYHANGYFDYVDPDNRVTPLYFNEIYPDATGMTHGYGKINDSDNFLINRDYAFCGDVSFTSGEQQIHFDGLYMMINPCLADYQWFKASADTISNDMVFSLHNDTLAPRCGMYYDEKNKEFFVDFFTNNLMYKPDRTVLSFNDELYYAPDYNGFINSGMLLQLDSCHVLGQGEMDLGVNTKYINFLTDGMFIYDIQNDEIRLQMSAMLDFTFDNKMVDNIAYGLFGAEEKDLVDMKFRKELGIIMDDLSMKWVGSQHCFVSDSEIYISSINDYGIGNYYDAVVLIDYNAAPTIVFYLKNEEEQWIFIKYSAGKTEVLASAADFNSQLEKKDPKTRVFVDKDTKATYEYGVGRIEDVNSFIVRLKYIQGK